MDRDLIEIRERLGRSATAKQWARFGIHRRFGICVPLFSLRSARSCGIGDIGDLRALADWGRRIGASVLQILPVNDMGLDSCPYSAISAFALDPVFIALDQLDALTQDAKLKKRVRETAAALNAAARVDYQRVRKEKMALLELAFRRELGPELIETLAAQAARNPWLDDYVVYRVIKESEEYRSWEDWGKKFPDPAALERLKAEHKGRLDRLLAGRKGRSKAGADLPLDRFTFHRYLQWVLERQLMEARSYANANGILVKGDIPILVSRDSADVWRNPRYFKMDSVAGAPPDMYSEDGQIWSFPTYDWEALRQTDYAWWRHRLLHAEQFFDLYRIDHVVGFFRIWTIRHGEKTGRHGWFDPAEESQWEQHGRRILEMMVGTSGMLPLAEDLGTIPAACRTTLRDMGICGMKVQRWEKRWEQDRSFIPPPEYHPLSVAATSTHDSETLSGWWEAYPEERQQLYRTLGFSGTAPVWLETDIGRRLISWISSAGSLFAIFLLQDLLDPFGLLPGNPSDHRINVPGTVGNHNWTWRCPVGLETLLADDDLAERIRNLHGRSV
jgi:4-alpha-glucanotransferase